MRWTPLIGLFLYVFDLVSDILLAIHYWKTNEFWWFRMTLIFIGAPSVIVNITAIFQVINILSFLAAVLQLSIVFRCIEAIISPNARTYSLAKLRYVETITESAPQWCLQMYIMLRQWKFPWYTVASIILSLLSLVWSITCLEKEREKRAGGSFNLCTTLLFIIWQFSTLVSRLSAIVIFAYVFRYHVFTFIAAHLCILAVIAFIKTKGIAGLLSWLAVCPSVFHSSLTVLPIETPGIELILGYVSLLVENVILVSLSLTIDMPGALHMDVLKPYIISCLVGGTVLSIIFFFLYYAKLDDQAEQPGT